MLIIFQICQAIVKDFLYENLTGIHVDRIKYKKNVFIIRNFAQTIPKRPIKNKYLTSVKRRLKGMGSKCPNNAGKIFWI